MVLTFVQQDAGFLRESCEYDGHRFELACRDGTTMLLEMNRQSDRLNFKRCEAAS